MSAPTFSQLANLTARLRGAIASEQFDEASVLLSEYSLCLQGLLAEASAETAARTTLAAEGKKIFKWALDATTVARAHTLRRLDRACLPSDYRSSSSTHSIVEVRV
jgi:hypothetical protein